MRIDKVKKWWPLAPIKSINTLLGGAINKLFKVSTRFGVYTVRVYLQKKSTEVNFEVELLNKLSDFPVPSPVKVKGNYAHELDGYPVVIYNYIPGNTVTRPNSRQTQEVGNFLAQLHNLGKQFKYSGKREKLYNFTKARARKYMDIGRNKKYQNRLQEVYQDVLDYQIPDRLPKSVIHVDVKPGNVLFSKGRLSGIIDFDNAYIGPSILDLAKSIVWFASENGKFSTNRAKQIYSGYTGVRALSKQEKNMLYATVRYAYASHLLVDFYMIAQKRIPKQYFSYLMNSFYRSYQDFITSNSREQFNKAFQ